MTKAEHIIWRAETRERVEKEHPEWNEQQVSAFVNYIEAVGKEKGFFEDE